MKFVSRARWGARAPRYRNDIGRVYGVTVHWNGPRVGNLNHSQCDDTMRGFQRYHMDTRGWSDVGYNFVVCQHGYVYEGRGIGVRGAHAGTSDIGGNSHWYGVQAMVGEGDDIPDDLLHGLREAIAYCRHNGAGNRVNGHRDHHATQCPGDELYRWAHGSPMEDDVVTEADKRDIARYMMRELKFDDPTRYPKGAGRSPEVDDINLVEAVQKLLEYSYGADAVPIPVSAFGQEYRDTNENFTGPNATSHTWDASEKGLKVGHQALKAVRQLADGLNVTVDVDEAELAAHLLPGLLAELSPEAIAAAVAEALPEYELRLTKKES